MRRTNTNKRLYRSRKGVIFGVCSGIADYFDLNPTGLRILAVALCFLSFAVPVIICYTLLAIILKPAPALPLGNDDETEFYNSYTQDKTLAVHRLKRMFTDLDSRLQRLETKVTSKDFDWQRRMRN